MDQSKISVRYAKALFELSVEKDILETIRHDIELLQEMCKMSDFKEFLNSPIIPISKKQKIFTNLFEKNVSEYVLNFLMILTQSRREAFLEIITLNYQKLYRDSLGIKEVRLTTAVEIPDVVKEEIIKTLTSSLNSEIEIIHNTDEDLIGGFVLNIEDRQLDTSVKTQLKEIKQQLIK